MLRTSLKYINKNLLHYFRCAKYISVLYNNCMGWEIHIIFAIDTHNTFTQKGPYATN